MTIEETEITSGDMTPLFEAIVKYVHEPDVDLKGPLQLQISTLDYNSYTDVIGIGHCFKILRHILCV